MQLPIEEYPVLRVDRLCGGCKGFRTIESLGLRIPGKSLFNFIKPGKTKGAAAVQVMYKLVPPARKAVAVRNISTLLRPGRVGGRVNCIPSFFNICSGLGIDRCVSFCNSVCHVASERVATMSGSLLRLIGLSSGGRICISALSHKVGRQLYITQTLVRGPSLLILSRPGSNLSPHTHIRVGRLLRGLHDVKGAVIVDSRVLSRLTRVYGDVNVVSRKGLMRTKGVRSIVRRIFNKGQVIISIRKRVRPTIHVLGRRPRVGIRSIKRGRVRVSRTVGRRRVTRLVTRVVRGKVVIAKFCGRRKGLRSLFVRLAKKRRSRGWSGNGGECWDANTRCTSLLKGVYL